MLELRGVAMAYGRNTLFSGVRADVSPGQCLVVTGANGAGKSTLLKIIAGLLRPEEGTVTYGGRRGYRRPRRAALRRADGPGEPWPFSPACAACPTPRTRRCWRKSAWPGGAVNDLVSAYSSGMRQRLKLAVSRLGDPALLLWDEPTATLDEAGRARAGDILARHCQRRWTCCSRHE